jgi:hypothetical protein
MGVRGLLQSGTYTGKKFREAVFHAWVRNWVFGLAIIRPSSFARGVRACGNAE